jgi:hypothetical protein
VDHRNNFLASATKQDSANGVENVYCIFYKRVLHSDMQFDSIPQFLHCLVRVKQFVFSAHIKVRDILEF